MSCSISKLLQREPPSPSRTRRIRSSGMPVACTGATATGATATATDNGTIIDGAHGVAYEASHGATSMTGANVADGMTGGRMPMSARDDDSISAARGVVSGWCDAQPTSHVSG
eukprot:5978082-Prymnesium_polylepis.2